MRHRTDERRLAARERERTEWARALVLSAAEAEGGDPAATYEHLRFVVGEYRNSELLEVLWREAFAVFARRAA